jgi:hypothetical protein
MSDINPKYHKKKKKDPFIELDDIEDLIEIHPDSDHPIDVKKTKQKKVLK